jgi:hypothetical protein
MLCLLIALAVMLELAAGVGLASLAGFHHVRHILRHVVWAWLPALCAALVVSFGGYYYAYRAIVAVGGTQRLSREQLLAMAAAGFGGVLAHSGGNLDHYALQAAGADETEARLRVAALGGLEYGGMAIGGCVAAIVVLVLGQNVPSGATIPWAVLPLPGFLAGFWIADRYPQLPVDGRGWRGRIARLLAAIRLIRHLFIHPLRWGWAWAAMTVFWVADAFAVWAGLAMFGYRMNGPALFVGVATGWVFTRRIGPLAGAGVLMAILPVTIWYCGAPFAIAVAGVFAYRVLAFWLPLPVSLAALPTLRMMSARGKPSSGDQR